MGVCDENVLKGTLEGLTDLNITSKFVSQQQDCRFLKPFAAEHLVTRRVVSRRTWKDVANSVSIFGAVLFTPIRHHCVGLYEGRTESREQQFLVK